MRKIKRGARLQKNWHISRRRLKALTLAWAAAIALQACGGPPKPPEPSGQWVPVNQPATQGAQLSTQSLARTESK